MCASTSVLLMYHRPSSSRKLKAGAKREQKKTQAKGYVCTYVHSPWVPVLCECSMSECYEDLEDFDLHNSYLHRHYINYICMCFVAHVLHMLGLHTRGLHACYSALCTPPHNRYSTYKNTRCCFIFVTACASQCCGCYVQYTLCMCVMCW